MPVIKQIQNYVSTSAGWSNPIDIGVDSQNVSFSSSTLPVTNVSSDSENKLEACLSGLNTTVVDISTATIPALNSTISNLRNDIDNAGDLLVAVNGSVTNLNTSVTSLNLALNQLFIWKQYNYAYSLTSDQSLSISAEDFGADSYVQGYRPLSIFSYNTGNGAVFAYNINPRAQSNENMVSIHNTTTQAKTGTITLRISYVKSDFISQA